LEKKPEQRFQTVSDLRFALEVLTMPSSGSASGHHSKETGWLHALPIEQVAVRLFSLLSKESGRLHRLLVWRDRLGWIVAALLLAALAFAGGYFRSAPVENENRATFTNLSWPVNTKSSSIATGAPAISPDGRHIAITAETEGVNHVWLYSLGAPEPKRLQGTEDARYPFWSPNGRNIGFFSGGKLKKIAVSGGSSETICEAPDGQGAAWGSAGVIIFAPTPDGTPLYRVSEGGDAPAAATSLDSTRLETGHIFPRFLPDGRHFVFLSRSAKPENTGIGAGSLDQLQTRFLFPSDSNAEFSIAGYLLFMRRREILARRFDAEKLESIGDPVKLAEQGNFNIEPPYTPLSVSGDGLLVYQGAGNPNTQLVWYDRNGRQLSSAGPLGEYLGLNISPDGKKAILLCFEPQKAGNDLWSFDLERETLPRVTYSPASTNFPLWSPEGDTIAYCSNRERFWAIWQKGVNDGDGKEELLFKEDSHHIFPDDWSSDGKFIVYQKIGEKTSFDLWLLPMSGDRQPKPYLTTQFDERLAKVSPDGRWLAYRSNESGRNEIYVQSFPEPGRRVMISKGGGNLPRWGRNGRELYYVAADNKLMAVHVETGANFAAGAPTALFDLVRCGLSDIRYLYDVSADGQKFLVIRPLEDASSRPLTLVQNWTELLKK